VAGRQAKKKRIFDVAIFLKEEGKRRSSNTVSEGRGRGGELDLKLAILEKGGGKGREGRWWVREAAGRS